MRKFFIQIFKNSELIGHIKVKSIEEALDLIQNMDMQCNLMSRDEEGYFYNEQIGINSDGDIYGIPE